MIETKCPACDFKAEYNLLTNLCECGNCGLVADPKGWREAQEFADKLEEESV
jgi:hypothetical protein